MNAIKIIVALILFSSCSSPDTKAIKKNSESVGTKKKDTIKPDEKESVNSKLASRAYGEGIISGQVKPTDNDETIAWLDSLQSINPETRQFAFSVYKAMALISGGALSEIICGHLKSYLQLFPQEFLLNYTKLENEYKIRTIENIAFEFYASGTDFKKDIDEYFKEIELRCKDCNTQKKALLEEVKIKVETQVSKYVN
jgi:hypothetical protein